MKFLIVAAKTGGHVYPASSIAKELISNDHEIIFLGTDSVIEKKAYADICSKSYNLSIQGFRGQNFIKKLHVLLSLIHI